MKPNTLISAKTLQRGYDQYLVIDCRFDLNDPNLGEKHYAEAHLPGAQYADLERHLSSPVTALTGRHPLPNFDLLAAQCERWGLSRSSCVVVYDDSGGTFAARLWWLLRTMGHSQVAVLDGGIQAWQLAGYPLDNNVVPTNKQSRFYLELDQSLWCDINSLQQQLASQSCILIDARAKERFDGVVEPIDPVAGHIPGALNWPVTNNLNSKTSFLDAGLIRQNYLKLIKNGRSSEVIHSCGSGVFACMGVLAMETAGLSGSKIYPGSWSEWIRAPSREVVTNVLR